SMCAQNDFDSQLIVYGGPCDNLACVAADDDGCAPAGSSVLTFCALAGRTYHILVTSWSGGGGEDTLTRPDTRTRCRRPAGDIRVSVTSTGGQTNGYSYGYLGGARSMTPDARWFVMSTAATNMVTPDANGTADDIVVRDRLTGAAERVSVGPGGVQGNAASA